MKNCSLEKNKNEDIITNSRSRILVVTNMYPSSKHPHYGIFVKNSVEILKDEGFSISLVCKKKEEFILNKILAYIVFYVKSIHMGLFGKYDVIYVHYVSHCALPVLIVKFFRKGIHIVANVHGNDIVPETEKDKKYIRLSKKNDKQKNNEYYNCEDKELGFKLIESNIETLAIIDTLNDYEKNIIKLMIINGYSPAEIAKKMGKSRQAINQAKIRALNKLKNFI